MAYRKRPKNETGLRVPSTGATTLRSESELIDFSANSEDAESLRGSDVSPLQASIDMVDVDNIRGGWVK